MNKIWLIAQRELKERLKSRSFIVMATIGPLVVLGLIYILFSIGGSEKKHWKVLIMDKQEILENKLMPNKDPFFDFYFINEFVDYDQFAELPQFQEYDMSVWINEKVLSNKKVIVSYRERPSESLQRRLIYHIERRIEEVMVDEFTDLSVGKFREIKQPLSFSFKNAYDPKNEVSYISGWVGYAFGMFIILFVFLFGMTILRSVSQEKSNRIVEILLAAVSPKKLLSGKILGIGITAVFQVFLWVVVIGIGLFVFRQTLFPNLVDPALIAEQMSDEVAKEAMSEFQLSIRSYNDFVTLIYEKIHFANMLLFFIVFFIGGFLFYGAFFAMIGASMGSESDGQQYIIPISLLLILSLVSGYYVIYYPGGMLANVFSFLPFTSPVVMMINLGNGFAEGTVWQLYLSILILYVLAFFILVMAGRIYKNGILQFGHRLRIGLFIKWLKKT